MIAALQKTADEDGISRMANWLVDQGAAEKVLELLPGERVRDQPILLATRLRALGTANRWDEVGEYLEREDRAKVMEPFLRHCYAAAMEISTHPNDPSVGERVLGHFENALAAARNRVAPILFIASYAENLRQFRAAISAHQRLLDFPPTVVPSAKAILRMVDAVDDVRIQHQTLRKLVDFLPDDRVYPRQYHYISCLLKLDLPQALAYYKDEVAKHPKDETIKLALAFAQFQVGQTREALDTLESANVDWSKAGARLQAIRVAILGASEDRVAAREIARRIDQSRLRSEEKKLIEGWL